MKLFGKILTFFILLRYPKISSRYRWFIRFRYLGEIRQIRYFFVDFLIRRPYKEIKFIGEFQQELLHVIPFAYWHYLNGTLERTISSLYTKEFYFFSPNHTELDSERNFEDNFNLDIPNAPHDVKLIRKKWKQVPFKKFYRNNLFIYEKPILIVANRYNTEWNRSPISFFDLTTLDNIFILLKGKYQIIYNRPPASHIANDNSEIMELGDYKWIYENHPEVIQVVDLYQENQKHVNNYNHLQLLLYANCERFISIHGGTATLASNFGGVNIIYSREGHEHYMKEFENIFPLLSDAKILHLRDYNTLLKTVRDEFL